LYGVLCVQIYVYSYNFPIDRRTIKFLAYFVFILETVQTALTGADVYYWFVAGFGNVDRLNKAHLGPIDVPIINAVTSLIVQGYFCYRIWVLNKRSSWVCWIIAVAAVTQSAAGMWSSVNALKYGKIEVAKTAIYLWSISSALADILIAMAMTLQLRKAIGNFSSFVIVRVVRLTVETNTLTATLAITSLVLYVTFPNESYFIYTVEIIGKVYSNTLLVSLNNRIYFRDHRLPEHGDSVGLPFPDGARLPTMIPLQFALPEPQPNRISSRFIISRPVEPDNGRGDDTGTDSPVPHPKECHLLPVDPEWAVGTPLSPIGQKDEVYVL